MNVDFLLHDISHTIGAYVRHQLQETLPPDTTDATLGGIPADIGAGTPHSPLGAMGNLKGVLDQLQQGPTMIPGANGEQADYLQDLTAKLQEFKDANKIP